MENKSVCRNCVQDTYQNVIDDVILNIRDHFLEDGVDEQVLQEFKQLWENKVKATEAVDDINAKCEKMLREQEKERQDRIELRKAQKQMQQQLRQVVGQVPPNNHVMMAGECRRVPIQLTMPQLPGSEEAHRSLIIEVPEIFLQGDHLKNIITSAVVSTTMNLSVYNACVYLQDQVNNAFINHQHAMAMAIPPQMHLMTPEQFMMNCTDITQCDGNDDDSSDDDLDDDDNDDQEDAEEVAQANRLEEEPLNSEDDVSDAEEAESFETENVIVCQYDKITRSRNRWKFHFKDGIMNLDGMDYVFQKANGDAEW